MINFLKTTLAPIFLLIILSFVIPKNTKYKCMIKMKDYDGEGAYVVVSLINPKGEYEKTLQILGDNARWFHEILFWWDHYEQKFGADALSGETDIDENSHKNWNTESIDGITGATITGGNSVIKSIEFDDNKINAGYKIRIETAVEDKEYYSDDVEFELTSKNLNSKINGKGFIQYIRLIPF